MLDRPLLAAALDRALARSPAVALVGPRQVGKTTLARARLPADSPNWFDLEDPAAAAALTQPLSVLRDLRGLVVIDEVQHAPDLFKPLRVLIDRPGQSTRFLLLGSASPTLLRQAAESLTGRIEIIEAGGFTLADTGPTSAAGLWWRGGFPRSFLSASDADSRAWRQGFIRNTVERDLPQLGLNAPAPAIHRFWSMLAHYHGQVWNAADPARSLGVNESTVRRYLDWMTQAYLVRQLQPWHANLGKRQVKAPKVYLRDSGLLHELLGAGDATALLRHPKAGASWEGFALDQVLRIAQPDEAWFWATHGGAELDLLMIKDGRRVGVEFKLSDAPALTPSMRIALGDLGLERLYVVYPGSRRYALADRVEAVPLTALLPEPDVA
ncbi:ATP-binding protein [Rubrivivax albus]|uniref:ATP-binding protein n=1 Tax=Rubrivivax albus TaxID=2499835 RepID=A0A437JVY4_9BURK|nr:ATP-binding protein [Rubrivivax albus]RVT51555.1 ATP-binding protein [Rubrivivax albus]